MSENQNIGQTGGKPVEALVKKIEGILAFINNAKQEIAALNPDTIKQVHLQSAHDELDAIIQATADATNTIMDSVEKIEQIDSLTDEQKMEISTLTVQIYEACTFQDITGQRISKIIKTLKFIEEQILMILDAFGTLKMRTEDLNQVKSQMKETAAGEKDPNQEEVDPKSLLNGPQLPDEAVSQNDIDALFNDLNKK